MTGGHRVIAPEEARKRLLQLLHETRQGASAMNATARSRFWWPGLDKEMERTSATCDVCVQVLPMSSSKTSVNCPATQKILSRVHINFLGPFKDKMTLVVVDARSKGIKAVPTKQATSISNDLCLREVFSRFGRPLIWSRTMAHTSRVRCLPNLRQETT